IALVSKPGRNRLDPGGSALPATEEAGENGNVTGRSVAAPVTPLAALPGIVATVAALAATGNVTECFFRQVVPVVISHRMQRCLVVDGHYYLQMIKTAREWRAAFIL